MSPGEALRHLQAHAQCARVGCAKCCAGFGGGGGSGGGASEGRDEKEGNDEEQGAGRLDLMDSAKRRLVPRVPPRPQLLTRTQHHNTETAKANTCMYSPKAPPANVAKLPPTSANRRSLDASSINQLSMQSVYHT